MQTLGDKCDCVGGLKHMSPDQGRDGHIGDEGAACELLILKEKSLVSSFHNEITL